MGCGREALGGPRWVALLSVLSGGQGMEWSDMSGDLPLLLPLGLTLSLVESALHFLVLSLLHIFHLYSNTCPTKHVSPNTSGTMSK